MSSSTTTTTAAAAAPAGGSTAPKTPAADKVAAPKTTDGTSLVFPIGMSVLLILSFFIAFTTGSFLAIGVLWLLVAMIVLLLEAYGFVNAAVLSPFSTPASQPVGSATSSLTTVNSVANEVFHISDNQFTYDDAPAVCAAYGAQLATLEQIIDSYNHGAEWCGYGW